MKFRLIESNLPGLRQVFINKYYDKIKEYLEQVYGIKDEDEVKKVLNNVDVHHINGLHPQSLKHPNNYPSNLAFMSDKLHTELHNNIINTIYKNFGNEIQKISEEEFVKLFSEKSSDKNNIIIPIKSLI